MFIELNSIYRKLGTGDNGIRDKDGNFLPEELVRTVRIKKNPNVVVIARLNRPGGWLTLPRQEFEDQYILHESVAPPKPKVRVPTPQELEFIGPVVIHGNWPHGPAEPVPYTRL